MDSDVTTALVEESAKRSGLVWVRAGDDPADAGEMPRPMWHVWAEGTLYLLTGGIEQPTPSGLNAGGTAQVTVPSKDKRSRLLVWAATVETVTPGTDRWETVVPLLAAKRLNSPDGTEAPARWARDCTVYALTPVGPPLETPDAPSLGSHAGPPVPTPATTPVPRPLHLFGRLRRARRQRSHP